LLLMTPQWHGDLDNSLRPGLPDVAVLSVGKRREGGWGMMGAPDQYGDSAKLHAQDLQRAMQRDQLAETKKLTRLRLIVRRVLGRQNPPPRCL
jgi:hypothetical protein